MPAAQVADAALLAVANRLDYVLLLHGGSVEELATFARLVHESGPYSTGPFVSLGTDILPDTLLEWELFGLGQSPLSRPPGFYRRGRVERASQGTLFLSEVAALSPRLQQKLLRVLDRREVRPITYEEIVSPVDFRLIAATCEDLESTVRAGRFRQDLYDRLAATVITVPAATPQP